MNNKLSFIWIYPKFGLRKLMLLAAPVMIAVLFTSILTTSGVCLYDPNTGEWDCS